MYCVHESILKKRFSDIKSWINGMLLPVRPLIIYNFHWIYIPMENNFIIFVFT